MHFSRRIGAVASALVIVFFLWSGAGSWRRTPTIPYTRLSGKDRAFANILNGTLGFQHIYAINLPSRTDRRDSMTLAATLSGLDITWVDGVAGQDVSDKALPADPSNQQAALNKGTRGCWRAHMDVLQRIVRDNVTSALIFEDDADWDVRLKPQMQTFARAARAFTQPIPPTQDSLATQYHNHPSAELNLSSLPPTILSSESHPTHTPYGPDWDVLWLGHCGTELPTTSTTYPGGPPPLRILIPDDASVPSPRHLQPHPFALQDALAARYPPHTRVVHASRGTVCLQAYAVSQRGARKLLWQFGLQTFNAGWDFMLRDWCDGVYVHGGGNGNGLGKAGVNGTGLGVGMGKGAGAALGNGSGHGGGGQRPPVCVAVQPPLFSHHYGKGTASDITAPGGGFVNKEKEMTPYLRLSVKLNMERLLNGLEPVEQWGDDGESMPSPETVAWSRFNHPSSHVPGPRDKTASLGIRRSVSLA